MYYAFECQWHVAGASVIALNYIPCGMSQHGCLCVKVLYASQNA